MEEGTLLDQYGIEDIYTMSEIEVIDLNEDVKEEDWALAHAGHFGVQKTWQRSRGLGLRASYRQIRQRWR